MRRFLYCGFSLLRRFRVSFRRKLFFREKVVYEFSILCILSTLVRIDSRRRPLGRIPTNNRMQHEGIVLRKTCDLNSFERIFFQWEREEFSLERTGIKWIPLPSTVLWSHSIERLPESCVIPYKSAHAFWLNLENTYIVLCQ